MIGIGVWFFAVADSLWMMVAMSLWFSLGQNMCSIPMSGIGPDQVPVRTRAALRHGPAASSLLPRAQCLLPRR